MDFKTISYRLSIGVVFVLLTTIPTSCLLYKKPTDDRMDDLKQSSIAAENVDIPDDWIFSRNDSLQEPLSIEWIEELRDTVLTNLIEEGLKYNSTLLVSQEKLNQIEIAMGISGANLYPSVNAVGASNSNINTQNSLNSLTFQASWELDIWGKNKSRFEADKRNYFSARYQNEKAKQSIAAMIARSYFLTIANNVQLAKFDAILQKTEALKELTLLRQKVGIANAVDVSNSNIEINQLKSQITNLKNAQVQAKRALELLVGRYPEGVIATQQEFPRIQNPLPATLPLNILESRPDILAQQYQLEKAFLEVQEARAARLPSLSISSSFGAAQSNVQEINNLFSNPLLNVGGSLITPIFNGGKLKRNLEIKNSEQRVAIEEYASTVLNALNEVESSWANLHTYEDQYVYEDQAIEELKSNLTLTQKQIEQGTNNTFNLLQKQRQLLKTEVSLVNLELNYIIERINLYIASGIASQSIPVMQP